MKEYKVIKKGFWKKDIDFEAGLNDYAREGWHITIAVSNGHGDFSKVILERDKNRYIFGLSSYEKQQIKIKNLKLKQPE